MPFTVSDALAGKVALVTGAASGIGRATARMLAEESVRIAAVDVDVTGLRTTVDAITGGGGDARAFPTDLSRAEAIEQTVAAVLAWADQIDILVNSAGVTGELVPFTEVSVAGWEFAQAVNLRAPMLMMQRVGRHMIYRGAGGRIVNISSSAAFRSGVQAASYVASKGGLSALTRVVAEELGPYNINVNAVAPGLTKTPMTSFYGGDEIFQDFVSSGSNANFLRRASEPEDVAAAVVFVCLPASRQISGQTIHTSAGTV